MNLEKLKRLHKDLMELGDEAHKQHDQDGIYVIGPVLLWLHIKIKETPEEVPDGAWTGV